MKAMYRKYPLLVETYNRRYAVYNETLDYLAKQVETGSVFIIRPQKPVTVGRLEKNKAKLNNFYNEACEDTLNLWPKLMDWLNSPLA